jgi:TRAP-type C4-dicarboxylate transport system permease small subunit
VFSRLRHILRKTLEAVALVLMTALALVVIAGIVFRKAGASLVWYDEVASILLVWLTYYGAGLAALDRLHLGFPKIVESLGELPRKVLLIVREAVVIGFFVLVAWAGYRVQLVLSGSYLASLPWVPLSLTQSVIPIGALVFILAEILSLAPEAPAETT